MRWFWGGVAVTLVAVSAQAVQMKLTRAELCEMADAVVIAEVTGTETRWVPASNGEIERGSWLAVSDVVKGKKADTLEVISPGGTIGDIGYWVEDVPDLVTNGRYLLFLYKVDNRLHVLGGEQGAIRILPTDSPRGESQKTALATVEACRAP